MPKEPDRHLSVDDSRSKARDEMERRSVRLGEELDQFLRLLTHQREALTNETLDGLGYKKLAADINLLKKMKELSAMFGHITDAKIRYDKAMKQLAETQTVEEEREAVKGYVKSLERQERSTFLRELVQWHNDTDDQRKMTVQVDA